MSERTYRLSPDEVREIAANRLADLQARLAEAGPNSQTARNLRKEILRLRQAEGI